jgi:hypothetical protein
MRDSKSHIKNHISSHLCEEERNSTFDILKECYIWDDILSGVIDHSFTSPETTPAKAHTSVSEAASC